MEFDLDSLIGPDDAVCIIYHPKLKYKHYISHIPYKFIFAFFIGNKFTENGKNKLNWTSRFLFYQVGRHFQKITQSVFFLIVLYVLVLFSALPIIFTVGSLPQ